MEIWQNISGFGGKYQVSTWGRIKNADGQILKPFVTEKGYYKIVLQNEQGKHRLRVHRIVASTFLSNPYGYECVNHIDGNKKNNSVSNLEYCNNADNHKHAAALKNGDVFAASGKYARRF